MFKVSKQTLERRAKVRHRFIEVREVTEMSTGTYEELTTFADHKKVMFMVKKKNNWKSRDLRVVAETVTGFKQDFARIYDCEYDAFIFQKYDETILNTAEVLNGESAWDGKERLTGDDILDYCEQLMDERLSSPVEYATSIQTSLFPDDTGTDINLKTIPTGLRHLKENGKIIAGLSTGFTYLGRRFTFFPVHKEDADAISINFCHKFGGKVWIGPSTDDNERFQDIIIALLHEKFSEGYADEAYVKCPALYRHKNIWINPLDIMEKGIDLYWCLQKEGYFVITPQSFYHLGMNLCPNVHEAWNMTSKRWSECDLTKTYCVCPQTQKPAKLAFWKKEGEVYKAKLLNEDKPTEVLMVAEEDQLQKVGVDERCNPEESSSQSQPISEKRVRKRKLPFDCPESAKRPSKRSICEPPTGVEITSVYAYKATLAWIEPTTAHEAVPTYSIEFRKDKSHKWKADDDYHKKAKATINGLVPGSTYVFRVVPWLNKIRGTPSLPTSSIVAENPYDVPSKPLNLRRSGDSIIEWEPPLDCTVHGYLVDVKLEGESHWRKARQGATTSPNFSFEKIESSFEIRVCAENEIGFGEKSDALFVDVGAEPVVLREEPIAPELLAAAVKVELSETEDQPSTSRAEPRQAPKKKTLSTRRKRKNLFTPLYTKAHAKRSKQTWSEKQTKLESVHDPPKIEETTGETSEADTKRRRRPTAETWCSQCK